MPAQSNSDKLTELLGDELEALASTLDARRSPAHELPIRGACFDRYTVLERIGAGAMGVVIAAYDPRLDRKVALKLLSARVASESQRSAHARLLSEGKALAKLDHPNVVAVHDIGEHDGRLFIAMELIAGQNLGTWLREAEEPRPWMEVVNVFLAAGRGLAAAHAVGLVHRDFKPENVMLGADGRVRVMDFGLARAIGAEGELLSTRHSQPSDGGAALHMTDTGAVLGTPAYMSPEQTRGDRADARSDQFSYCVALYEALYGLRPFVGASLEQLFEAIASGAIREPPPVAMVPSWLHQIVERGLSTDPARRFASMQDLLDALGRDPSLRRQQALGLTLVAGLTAGIAGIVATADTPEDDTCAQIEDELAGIWDQRRRAELHDTIIDTELSYAQSTWTRVEAELDSYTARWVDVRTQACQAHQLGTESDTLFDLRMACLKRRLLEVEALVDVFAEADDEVVLQAVNATHALRDLEQCADVNALDAELRLPSDPRVAARVDALSQRLIEAGMLHDAGKYAAGLVLADAVVNELQELDYAPLLARARLRQGQLREKLGDYEGSEEALELAYTLALAHVMVDEAAEAATQLIYVVGEQLARHRDGLRWGRDAQPLTQASGSPRQQARVLSNLGVITASQGEYQQALDYHERALALDQRSFGAEHPVLANTFSNLGSVAVSLGDFSRGQEHYAHALAVRELAYGPDHPDVADSLNNLGIVFALLGENEQARDNHERALAIRGQALGPEHPDFGASLNNLGNVVSALGDYERARELYTRALVIRERTLAPGHPQIAASLNNLAAVAYSVEDYEQASAYHERALALREKTFGPDHPLVARSLYNLAESESRRGAGQRARPLYARALSIMEQTLGPEHPSVAYPLTGMGVLALASEDFPAAIDLLTRALDIRPHGGTVAQAETSFALARALWAADPREGRDRERARALARSARTSYLDAGAASPQELTEVDAWLATHGELPTR